MRDFEEKRSFGSKRKPMQRGNRPHRSSRTSMAKFALPKDSVIDYKNFPLLQKYINDRGKIVSRRVSGVTAKEQRKLANAIKDARFLALLTTGGARR